MAEIRRTLMLHPIRAGQFDLVLLTRDGIAHSAMTNLSSEAYDALADVLTEAGGKIRKIVKQNVDWERIGK